ncbi:MAG: nucleotidyltransferase [Cyanobacteria bacterium M_surface_10_m1_298]|nr:nucleotidyltransferase [Cyanobacteria bacterium M_surface_10_m1_298]
MAVSESNSPPQATAVLNQLRLHKPDWSRRFHVIELGLFGSVARGHGRADSDLDVWVQIDPLTPYALVHLKKELEDLLQRPVDLVRVRERMSPALRQRIEQEGLRA